MNSQAGGVSIDLRDYLTVLGRRKWLIAAVAVIVTATAWLRAEMQEPVYQSAATVLLKPRVQDIIGGIGSQQPRDAARNLATESQVITGAEVRALVAARLGSAPKVSTRAASGADIVAIISEGPDPARTAQVANAYAEAYIEHRRNTGITDAETVIAELEQRIAEVQAQIDAYDAEIAAAPPADRAAVSQRLGPARSALLSQVAAHRETIARLQLNRELSTGGAESLTRAAVPTSPVRPNPQRSALTGLAIGLALGVALAYLWDGLENPLRAESDLREIASELPVMALIPKVKQRRRRGRRRRGGDEETFLPSLREPDSPAAEAYRTLRTALGFADAGTRLKLIAVTSPLAGEGKTSTVANLGVAFASAGTRVVIVSCDLRRPRLHQSFDLPNDVGLSTVLTGRAHLSEVLHSVPGVKNLRVIPSGPSIPNPSEALGSATAGATFSTLRENADVILLDCPPVLPVTDAVVLSALVDGVLLQSSAGLTTRRQLGRAIEILHLADAPLIGTVLNRVEQRAYSYGYATEYYEATRRQGEHRANGAATAKTDDRAEVPEPNA